MVEYKNQHYVPRFYLRNFSDDGQSIWLYNMEADREFKEPISQVCARDYFYSEETDIEKAIGSIERSLSDGLKQLLAKQSVARFQTEDELKQDWHRVLQFLAFQEARTALSKKEIERDSDVLFETIVEAGVEAGRVVETSAGSVGFADDHRVDATPPRKPQAERLPALVRMIDDIADEESGAPHDAVVKEVAADAETVEDDLESLKQKGAVYEPERGGGYRSAKRPEEGGR